MITHRIEIDIVSEGVPTNATPNSPPSPGLAYIHTLQVSQPVTSAGGLISVGTEIYQPDQIRIVNNTDGTIWWTVISEDEYLTKLEAYPDLFHFFEIDNFEYRYNGNSTGLAYFLLYLGTATTGTVVVEEYNCRIHKII